MRNAADPLHGVTQLFKFVEPSGMTASAGGLFEQTGEPEYGDYQDKACRHAGGQQCGLLVFLRHQTISIFTVRHTDMPQL